MTSGSRAAPLRAILSSASMHSQIMLLSLPCCPASLLISLPSRSSLRSGGPCRTRHRCSVKWMGPVSMSEQHAKDR